MAQYFTNFSEYALSEVPSDWTEQWGASGTGDVIVITAGDDKCLQIHADNTAEGASWNDIDSDADRDDVEVLAKIALVSLATYITPSGFGVRASYPSSQKDGYIAGITDATTIRIRKVVAGTATTISSATVSTLSVDTFYWLRFRVNGSSLKLAISSSSAYPSSWDIDTTDTAITTAGWVMAQANGSAADPYYDTFGVGTNGDTAPSSAPATGITASARNLLLLATG